jgi:hypothetical protein
MAGTLVSQIGNLTGDLDMVNLTFQNAPDLGSELADRENFARWLERLCRRCGNRRCGRGIAGGGRLLSEQVAEIPLSFDRFGHRPSINQQTRGMQRRITGNVVA